MYAQIEQKRLRLVSLHRSNFFTVHQTGLCRQATNFYEAIRSSMYQQNEVVGMVDNITSEAGALRSATGRASPRGPKRAGRRGARRRGCDACTRWATCRFMSRSVRAEGGATPIRDRLLVASWAEAADRRFDFCGIIPGL